MKKASLCAVVVILSCGLAVGQHGQVLHSFSGPPDGFGPVGNLVLDAAGNIYGTTTGGGSGKGPSCDPSCGVVFELSHVGGGVTETILYNFCSLTNCADGARPLSGVILDSAGNLYGTTEIGGLQNNCVAEPGCGVVFELSPNSDGTWTETILHSFTGADDDGENPECGLIFDAGGNLYGATPYAGTTGGLVFELSPTSGGVWNETVLYAFTDGGTSGSQPNTNLIFDRAGNLYGIAGAGGSQNAFCSFYSGCGVVFELTPSQGNSWQETVLHTFTDGVDGAFPIGGLTLDPLGNLFGTTTQGGNSGCIHGCGVVFELTPGPGGWTENVLYSFTGGADGAMPDASLTIGPNGKIYGTASAGGNTEKDGVVFELIPTPAGEWNEKALSFGGKFGFQPDAGLTFAPSGHAYGTTMEGGAGRGGVVLEITK